MKDNLKLNADRFRGFAEVYDNARPKCPEKVRKIILNYLGYNPELVVDMGCGTGLSTTIWSDVSNEVVGLEPSGDMLKIAKRNSSDLGNVRFVSAFSDNTGLDNHCADVITCSQSFHWMNPELTLNEVSRVLKKGGVFAVYDYDWPPVCNWEVESEYDRLLEEVREIESSDPILQDSFVRWDKDQHLTNISKSGKFRYVREIVFLNHESSNAQRLIELALSQGGLQAILKKGNSEIKPFVTNFQEKIAAIYGKAKFEIGFCYRMRIGIK